MHEEWTGILYIDYPTIIPTYLTPFSALHYPLKQRNYLQQLYQHVQQLSALDYSRTTWRIKVRVTRMWSSVSNGSNGYDGLRGYNLILLDDNVSTTVLRRCTLTP